MIRIDERTAIALHLEMAKVTGGDVGVREAGLLDSALAAPYQSFGGEDLYPTVEQKAARLGFSLIANHPFVDGNKRIGMFVMLVYLEANGVTIDPSNGEVVRAALAVASSEMSYDGLLEWILENKTE